MMSDDYCDVCRERIHDLLWSVRPWCGDGRKHRFVKYLLPENVTPIWKQGHMHTGTRAI